MASPLPPGTTIVWFDFANIGANPIAVVLVSDGSLFQVNTLTSVATQMAPPGTILNPAIGSIGLTQWGSQYVLIVARQTDGYFAWDGTVFYSAGDPVPGMGNMPTGISGTAIETYQSRACIVNGPILLISTAEDFTDFATADGGVALTSTDSFLRVNYINLKQTNGFLYLIGDSSVSYISGIQTSGSTPTTTFTFQNADPEIGTPYANTVTVFSRNIVFANAFGVHVSYGGSVAKISDALDGVYTSVPNFGGVAISAAKAIIFGKKCWMVLVPVIDFITGQHVNKLFLWDDKKWFSSDQDVTLIYIASQEINSVLTAWGTDGNALIPLFQVPSTAFTKRVQSKLWDRPGGLLTTKASNRVWGMANYYNSGSPDLTVSIDNEKNGSAVVVIPGLLGVTIINVFGNAVVVLNTLGDEVVILGSGIGVAVFPPTATAQQGVLLGVTVTTDAADVALISIMIDDQIVGYRG